MKSFLGMVLYYQDFIPNCSSIVKPLFALTAGQKRWGPAAKDSKSRGVYSSAFHQLKKMLLECVVLAHPDFDKPFILSVDASLDGLGAVLSQVPHGGSSVRPIAYTSKTLSAQWSVFEKFSHWLKARSFTIWTDNNPITYLLTKPKLDACEIR